MNAPLAKEQIALLMSDSLTYRSRVVEGTDGTYAEPAPSLFQRLTARIAGFAAHLRQLPQRQAVINELSILTDRELADIGLSRSELGRVFDPTFARARRRF